MCCGQQVTELGIRQHGRQCRQMHSVSESAEDVIGWDLRLQVAMSVYIFMGKEDRARTKRGFWPMEIFRRPFRLESNDTED